VANRIAYCVIGQPDMEGKTMALYLMQERWGRVCLHFGAALRAGHWGWHFAGIGREIRSIWPQTHRASAAVDGWPDPSNKRKARPT
jgi:hypothetical protein